MCWLHTISPTGTNISSLQHKSQFSFISEGAKHGLVRIGSRLSSFLSQHSQGHSAPMNQGPTSTNLACAFHDAIFTVSLQII